MNLQKIIEKPEVLQITGSGSGMTSAIMVGVHGNEKVGVNLLDRLRRLHIENGTVFIILANPTAVEQSKRYINVNLNRRFGAKETLYPEDRLSRNICAYLDKADALLDIHSYNEPMDRPFVITEKSDIEIAAKFPVSIISTGWDAFEAGASDDYMHKAGKVGICLECGSAENPDKYDQLALECVVIFLTELGHITPTTQPVRHAETQKHIKIVSIAKKKTAGLRFSKDFSTFDELPSDEIFAWDGDIKYRANHGQYILFPRPNNNIGDEAFLIGELAN